MILFVKRFQRELVRLILCAAALASMMFDRLCTGGDGLVVIAADAPQSPSEMLLRFTTIMLAGSLSMLALGYPTRS